MLLVRSTTSWGSLAAGVKLAERSRDNLVIAKFFISGIQSLTSYEKPGVAFTVVAAAAHRRLALCWGLFGRSFTERSHSSLAVAENNEAQLQPVGELHSHLKRLGLPRKLIERIARKRHSHAPQLGAAGQLQERIQALWAVTKADTPHKQQAIIKTLYHVPQLLNYQPNTLQHKAAQLQAVLQPQGLSTTDVQLLISRQPAVLTFDPQTIAHKVQYMCQQLSRPAPEVCSMWARQRTLINISSANFAARLQQLSELLSLQPSEVAMIIEQFPAVAASNMATVQQRLTAIQECLPDWSRQKLGRGLMSYASVLTCSADTIKHKWAVVTAYAGMHPASKQQLDRQRDKVGILNVFTRQANRFQFLQYIIASQELMQQQIETDSINSIQGSLMAHKQLGVQHQHQGVPAMLKILNYRNSDFKAFVDESFINFWTWQQEGKQG